jgi:transcriptional regulator with XRE-family HTH domain
MDDADGARLRAARIEAGIGLDILARITGKSKSHLSRVERGIRPLTPGIVLAYHRALGWSLPIGVTTSAAGSVPADDDIDEAEMRRRTLLRGFVATTTGIGAGTPLADEIESVTGPVAAPTMVSEFDAEELEQAALALTSRDLRGGGHALISEGQSLLTWATGLIEQTRSEPLRKRLASAAGYLADRTGWTAFDLGLHDQATRMFGLGVRLAAEADDRNLTAQALCDMAGQAVFLGKPSEALACAELALADESIVDQLKAALLGVTAEAYGQLGELNETLRYIDLAYERAIDSEIPDDAPVWLPAFRGPQTLMASTGFAAYLSYQQNRHTLAASTALEHLSVASSTLGSSRGRSATLCRLRQASISCAAGESAEGIPLAGQAVSDLQLARSTRIRRELRILREALPTGNQQATAVSARIDRLLTGQVVPIA